MLAASVDVFRIMNNLGVTFDTIVPVATKCTSILVKPLQYRQRLSANLGV